MITETARGIVPRVIERIDDKRRNRALRLLRAGRSVPEIAKELDVSEAWVRKLGAGKVAARPVGRPPGTTKPPSDVVAEARAEAHALLREGLSPREIAAKLGRSPRTIYLYLQGEIDRVIDKEKPPTSKPPTVSRAQGDGKRRGGASRVPSGPGHDGARAGRGRPSYKEILGLGERVLALHEQGLDVDEIAAKLGRSPKMTKALLRAVGAMPEKTKRPATMLKDLVLGALERSFPRTMTTREIVSENPVIARRCGGDHIRIGQAIQVIKRTYPKLLVQKERGVWTLDKRELEKIRKPK